MTDAFARAIAFQREFDRRRSEIEIRSTHGVAYLTPDLPRVYDLNTLVVDLGASASAEVLMAEAEAIFAAHGYAHRKVSVDDELGSTLAPAFRAAGWHVDEHLVMPHARPAPPMDISAVSEVEAEELLPAWTENMRRTLDEETIAQLVEAQLGRRAGAGVRYFATRADGRIASYCELFSDGRTGQIESVMTGEEFRRRGLGKAVVAGALAASQALHDFTFIVAEANDWPKELYRKLGFQGAGMVYRFLLRLRDVATAGTVEGT